MECVWVSSDRFFAANTSLIDTIYSGPQNSVIGRSIIIVKMGKVRQISSIYQELVLPRGLRSCRQISIYGYSVSFTVVFVMTMGSNVVQSDSCPTVPNF